MSSQEIILDKAEVLHHYHFPLKAEIWDKFYYSALKPGVVKGFDIGQFHGGNTYIEFSTIEEGIVGTLIIEAEDKPGLVIGAIIPPNEGNVLKIDLTGHGGHIYLVARFKWYDENLRPNPNAKVRLVIIGNPNDIKSTDVKIGYFTNIDGYWIPGSEGGPKAFYENRTYSLPKNIVELEDVVDKYLHPSVDLGKIPVVVSEGGKAKLKFDYVDTTDTTIRRTFSKGILYGYSRNADYYAQGQQLAVYEHKAIINGLLVKKTGITTVTFENPQINPIPKTPKSLWRTLDFSTVNWHYISEEGEQNQTEYPVFPNIEICRSIPPYDDWTSLLEYGEESFNGSEPIPPYFRVNWKRGIIWIHPNTPAGFSQIKICYEGIPRIDIVQEDELGNITVKKGTYENPYGTTNPPAVYPIEPLPDRGKLKFYAVYISGRITETGILPEHVYDRRVFIGEKTETLNFIHNVRLQNGIGYVKHNLEKFDKAVAFIPLEDSTYLSELEYDEVSSHTTGFFGNADIKIDTVHIINSKHFEIIKNVKSNEVIKIYDFNKNNRSCGILIDTIEPVFLEFKYEEGGVIFHSPIENLYFNVVLVGSPALVGINTTNGINGRSIAHNLNSTNHFTFIIPLYKNGNDEYYFGQWWVEKGNNVDIIKNTGNNGLKFYYAIFEKI